MGFILDGNRRHTSHLLPQEKLYKTGARLETPPWKPSAQLGAAATATATTIKC